MPEEYRDKESGFDEEPKFEPTYWTAEDITVISSRFPDLPHFQPIKTEHLSYASTHNQKKIEFLKDKFGIELPPRIEGLDVDETIRTSTFIIANQMLADVFEYQQRIRLVMLKARLEGKEISYAQAQVVAFDEMKDWIVDSNEYIQDQRIMEPPFYREPVEVCLIDGELVELADIEDIDPEKVQIVRTARENIRRPRKVSSNSSRKVSKREYNVLVSLLVTQLRGNLMD